jgi:hypothetical protein
MTAPLVTSLAPAGAATRARIEATMLKRRTVLI